MSDDILDMDNPEFNGRVDVLFSDDGLRISVTDKSSRTRFVDVHLNQSQTCQALSRVGHTPCKIITRGLDKIGKTLEVDRLSFPLPPGADFRDKEEAQRLVSNHVPDGWIADESFSSQDSFSKSGDEQVAHTTIRRYV